MNAIWPGFVRSRRRCWSTPSRHRARGSARPARAPARARGAAIRLDIRQRRTSSTTPAKIDPEQDRALHRGDGRLPARGGRRSAAGCLRAAVVGAVVEQARAALAARPRSKPPRPRGRAARVSSRPDGNASSRWASSATISVSSSEPITYGTGASKSCNPVMATATPTIVINMPVRLSGRRSQANEPRRRRSPRPARCRDTGSQAGRRQPFEPRRGGDDHHPDGRGR